MNPVSDRRPSAAAVSAAAGRAPRRPAAAADPPLNWLGAATVLSVGAALYAVAQLGGAYYDGVVAARGAPPPRGGRRAALPGLPPAPAAAAPLPPRAVGRTLQALANDATWGGDAQGALQACLPAGGSGTDPSADAFLGGIANSNIAYGAAPTPLFGANNLLLGLADADKILQVAPIAAAGAGAGSAVNVTDVPRAAALASMLVTAPAALQAAFVDNGATVTFQAQLWGDISLAPVRQPVGLGSDLPLRPDGSVAGYASTLQASLAPFFRKLALAIDACGNSDIVLDGGTDALALVKGRAYYQDFDAQGGVASAFVANAHSGLSGVIQFTGSVRTDIPGLHFTDAGTFVRAFTDDGTVDLLLRTDAPYGYVGGAGLGYVSLCNMITTAREDTRSLAGYTAGAQTQLFNVPNEVLDAMGARLGLA